MTQIASGTYVAELVRRAWDRPDEIERELERKGSWSDWNEWRIGTVTEEQIERVPDGYEVSSACDLRFTVKLPSLEDALVARKVFYLLHGDLFYSFGWPSWAGYMRMNAEDPARRPHSADANPYLVQLYDDAFDEYEPRLGEIGGAIERDGIWEERGKKIHSVEGYPEITAEGTGPALPEFEGSVRRLAFEVRWRSPTTERAAVFVGILDRLLADLIRAGIRSRPNEETTA